MNLSSATVGFSKPGVKCQQGFTLVEVVIAIALFALIALVGWQLVDQLQTTQVRGEAASQKQSELIFFHSTLMSDLKLLAPTGQGSLISVSEDSVNFAIRLAAPVQPGLESDSSDEAPETDPEPVAAQVSYQLRSDSLFRESSPAMRSPVSAGMNNLTGITSNAPSSIQGSALDQPGSISTELINQISELKFELVPFSEQQNSANRFAQISSSAGQQIFPDAPSMLKVSFSYQGLGYDWVFALPAYGILMQSANRVTGS